MLYLYPGSLQEDGLNEALLALKIARHSRCSVCRDSCPGLRPPPGSSVILDTNNQSGLGDLTQYGSDDEEAASGYLEICACGHGYREHGYEESVGKDELARRGRAAIRLDELLADSGRLVDFDYTDEDIDSLRKQMVLPERSSSPLSEPGRSPSSSGLSDPPQQPPQKRQRFSHSVSSLSDAEDDEDDEDQPLAARVPQRARTSGKRAGKKGSGMKSVSHTAPPAHQPTSPDVMRHPNGRANGSGSDEVVKVEEKLDESQLTRLVTGVTVDAGAGAPTPTTTKPEKAVYVEMREGLIQVTAVENDGEPRSLIILTGLKRLFQKQLPKMPREYIARLVYDTNSKCLAIVKYGLKVVGGICFRPFPQRGFAEIVFFATASVDQVKGYGGMLMNHFKAHIRKTYPDMMHFLTYADNYAVGYFKKQGFTKEITLDRSVWAGYIKDYEGGTIMQCKMLPKVDYLNVQELIAQQRDAVLSKIRESSKSHIVYEGLPQFREGASKGVTVNPQDVPGLRETGWHPSMLANSDRPTLKNPQAIHMRRILGELQAHPLAWPFLHPVNGEEVADYYAFIKHPMDFSTMEHKLDTNQYSTMDAFVADANLVFSNCRQYNNEGSVYVKGAMKLEKFLKELLEKIELES